MVTADCPSRKRGMKDGYDWSTAPGSMVAEDPTEEDWKINQEYKLTKKNQKL